MLSRGFHSAIAVLKPADSYLLHRGTETWRLGAGTTAIPLLEPMNKLAAS